MKKTLLHVCFLPAPSLPSEEQIIFTTTKLKSEWLWIFRLSKQSQLLPQCSLASPETFCQHQARPTNSLAWLSRKWIVIYQPYVSTFSEAGTSQTSQDARIPLWSLFSVPSPVIPGFSPRGENIRNLSVLVRELLSSPSLSRAQSACSVILFSCCYPI